MAEILAPTVADLEIARLRQWMDAHDNSPSKGVRVPSVGLKIDADGEMSTLGHDPGHDPGDEDRS